MSLWFMIHDSRLIDWSIALLPRRCMQDQDGAGVRSFQPVLVVTATEDPDAADAVQQEPVDCFLSLNQPVVLFPWHCMMLVIIWSMMSHERWFDSMTVMNPSPSHVIYMLVMLCLCNDFRIK